MGVQPGICLMRYNDLGSYMYFGYMLIIQRRPNTKSAGPSWNNFLYFSYFFLMLLFRCIRQVRVV